MPEFTHLGSDVQLGIKSVAATPPVRMHMSSSELQLLEAFKARLEHWGWRWRLAEDQSTAVVLTHFGCLLDATMSPIDLQASALQMPVLTAC